MKIGNESTDEKQSSNAKWVAKLLLTLTIVDPE